MKNEYAWKTMPRGLCIIVILLAVAVSAESAVGRCGEWLSHPSHGEQLASNDGGSEQNRTASVRESVNQVQERPVEPAFPRRCSGPLCKQTPLGSFPRPE